MNVVRKTRVLLQVKTMRHIERPVWVTAYVCEDGRTRIPNKSYDQLVAKFGRGRTFRL